MADPTQDDANKKPTGEGAAKPVPAKEEVSAADLLSLWGGGAPSPVSAKPKPEPKLEPKPESKPEPKSEPKLEEPEPKLKPKPKPKPKLEPKLEPKPVPTQLQPAEVALPNQAPKPVPPPPLPPEPAPASKIIQPETAFWEIPKPPASEPVKTVAPAVHIEEPPMPKPKPVPPPPPAPSLPPIAPKKEPVAAPIEESKVEPKPKPKVKIDSDIFEETPPTPVKKNEKAPKEIFEGEIVSSKSLPPLPPPPEEQPENLNEENGLGSQVDEFLEELNLSRKHIFYGIGCLVLIIVLIFGGIWGYKFYKNRASSEPKSEQQQPQSKEPATALVPVADTSTGIVSTKELGKLLDMNLVGSTGVNATSAVGVELTGSSGISSYIMTFKRLQNAYETDINELLNQATDRRGRLNSHLALLGKFYVDGTLINFQIQQEAEQIKIQYEEKKKVQQTHDSNFFDQIKALNPQTTENILSDFINVSKEIVVLRARFKALQKIRSYYEFALPKLNARIKDIELNAEALILGLKVYDVKGSDLKLIIPIESSAGETKNESLESSSGAGLFINPASVSTGHDYIQSPGGGF